MSDTQNIINPAHLTATLDKLGLTNDQVARVSGITPSTLYRWLNGSVPIHPGIMLLLEILALDAVWTHPGVSQRVYNAINRR